MNIVVLDVSTLGEDIDLSPIRALGQTSEYATTTPTQVAERIKDADVVITNKMKLNADNLKDSAVKLICVSATGYDNIDLDYCSKQGIALCNVPGYSTDSVAQVTVAMALSLVNHLSEYQSYVSDGSYSASGIANRLTPIFHELSSMTWGIVGAGGIGSRVAEMAQALGCRVLMCRQKKEGNYPLVDMDTLCRESDIVSLHLPLTENTRHILDERRIALLKPSAIVINVARGAVTDEEALAKAVEESRIGGLGVDVYSVEPFGADHPFARILNCKNVCLTPHMAWGSVESRARCVSVMAQNITNFFGGVHYNRIV